MTGTNPNYGRARDAQGTLGARRFSVRLTLGDGARNRLSL
jgi:hypothetical protein